MSGNMAALLADSSTVPMKSRWGLVYDARARPFVAHPPNFLIIWKWHMQSTKMIFPNMQYEGERRGGKADYGCTFVNHQSMPSSSVLVDAPVLVPVLVTAATDPSFYPTLTLTQQWSYAALRPGTTS